MDIHIRPAGQNDLKAIVSLIRELVFLHGDTTSLDDNYALGYLEDEDTTVLVADFEGEVAGVISFLVKPDLYVSALVALIEELIVDKRYRGKKIGRRLLESAFRIMIEKGVTEVAITVDKSNEVAHDLYNNMGFEDTEDLLLIKQI